MWSKGNNAKTMPKRPQNDAKRTPERPQNDPKSPQARHFATKQLLCGPKQGQNWPQKQSKLSKIIEQPKFAWRVFLPIVQPPFCWLAQKVYTFPSIFCSCQRYAEAQARLAVIPVRKPSEKVSAYYLKYLFFHQKGLVFFGLLVWILSFFRHWSKWMIRPQICQS